eukprot:1146161-Pelagomonas_calceolata.AAC.7
MPAACLIALSSPLLQSSWAGYARRLLVRAFVTAYPWCHAAMESSTLAYHIAYLLRVAPTHRPTLHALRMQVSRVSAQDMVRRRG